MATYFAPERDHRIPRVLVVNQMVLRQFGLRCNFRPRYGNRGFCWVFLNGLKILRSPVQARLCPLQKPKRLNALRVPFSSR